MTNTYKILINAYSNLFTPNFEVGCNDGWSNIIEDLLIKLSELGVPKDFKIIQIKEKFGVARIYHTGGSKELNDLIDAAEMATAKVCEECGESGKMDDSAFWMRTLCDDCSRHRALIRGLNLAASKTHCRACLDEIKEQIEKENRRHAIDQLSRYGQKLQGT